MIDGKIAQANGRLKAARVGVVIQACVNRLYLRATLPPRPDAANQHPRQQRIALGIHANPYGVSLAEKEARKVGALLDCNEFDWTPYLKVPVEDVGSIGYWLRRFEHEFKEEVTEVTWKTEYKQVLDRLDPHQPLTPEQLKLLILQTKPNTRTRKRYCTTLSKLAAFAGLQVDFKPLQGKYSTRQVDPRSLPTDEQIVACFHQIKHPAWQWIFGVIATYGLRNHEAFFLDTTDLEQGRYWVTVQQGKTGRRLVWACDPEWVEQFDLRTPKLPDVTGKTHADYGERVSQFFRRSGLPAAYDLRHRWAVRTLEFRLPVELSAQQMGHSVKVHCETYHRWITADVHQRAFEALMLRDDRPPAP
jgi:integrase